MPIVLDNTKGTSLGMAMVQHSMDNLVKQRMQMNELYHDANKAVAVTGMQAASAEAQEYINRGENIPSGIYIRYNESANYLNKSRNMTAAENKTIQESSPEFQQYYDIDSWDKARKKNMVNTGPNALSRLGGAISNVMGAASKYVGGLMGNSPGASGITTAPPTTPAVAPAPVATPAASAAPVQNAAIPQSSQYGPMQGFQGKLNPLNNVLVTPFGPGGVYLKPDMNDPNKMTFDPLAKINGSGGGK